MHYQHTVDMGKIGFGSLSKILNLSVWKILLEQVDGYFGPLFKMKFDFSLDIKVIIILMIESVKILI